MLQRIIDFSIRNRWLVLLAVALGCCVGYRCLVTMPLDALPEMGDVQVIVYSQWDRSPDLVEDQVTYPIVTALLGAPHVKAVRGYSDYGYSFVYVVFDEDTDPYWARSRTLEYLSGVRDALPAGVRTQIGPDATSLGWVFQYVVVDRTGKRSLADLRSYQDWYLRYALKSVRGVADVAAVGGFEPQFQVRVDPLKLQGHGLTIAQVTQAVRGANEEASGRMLDFGGTEYMIRGRGYAKTVEDFGQIVVALPEDGAPVRIRDIGEVTMGPDLRRGIADLDGTGDAVSGIVIMRSGENALQVVSRVKDKIRELQPGLPPGLEIVPVYDRSSLIRQTIGSARSTILQVLITVALIIAVFLWHFPSAAIPLITMPVALLLSFIPLRLMGVSANVMSLAGIAIACGELIDASIVIVEQVHKRLEEWERNGRAGSAERVVTRAVKEVAGPTFFALLVIAVAFLPVLTLRAQEGQAFRPLAYAKSSAMLVAAILVLTLDPALRLLLTRRAGFSFRPVWLCRVANTLLVGRIRPEEKHPVSRVLIRLYEPIVSWTLRRKWIVLGGAAALMVVTIPVFVSLGSEFMPPMNEGTILYMPTTLPGISVAEARQVLQATDRILKDFPEVDHVLGKAGRADTPTDPAPLSMLETMIVLKPRSAWRHVPRWYTGRVPEWAAAGLRHLDPDTLSLEDLESEMDRALQIPGVSNAWTMPIRGRVDMLTSGMRTPLGIKIYGNDIAAIEKVAAQIEATLPGVRGTRSVFAERLSEGHFIDINWRRDDLARYGISMADAQTAVSSAIGGDNISTVVSGAERYPVSVRYLQDFRADLDALGRVLVPAAGKREIAIRDLADIRIVKGPSMIRDEDGSLTGYVYVDLANRDIGSYVKEAGPLLAKRVVLPAGAHLAWSGQYEAMQRAHDRLLLVVPGTLGVVAVLIWLSTRSLVKMSIVMLAVPFSAIGAVWMVYLLHYNMSVAVWVGMLGLMSIDAETGVFMLLYLDLAWEDAERRNQMHSLADLRRAIRFGAARRLRPKFMTFATTCIGLFPVMWSMGTGADVMKRIAAPMIGGILASFLLELLVYPPLYELWRRRSLPDPEQDDSTAVYAADLSSPDMSVASLR